MKWLIYFLLIANIGFAAWHYRGVNSSESAIHKVDVTNESQLILLSEFYQQQKKPTASTTGRLCYSLGPLIKKSDANSVLAMLNPLGINAKQTQRRDTSESGYWVILPASESRKEANKHIQKLKKLKVKDYFLVATGSRQNAVSLGVYSQKKLARRRVDEMIRLGFVPRMESVALPRKVYWLEWYKDAKKQLSSTSLAEIKNKYSQVSQIERSCK